VGDTVTGWDWLQWLSPLGWVTRVDAYGGDRLPVLGLFLAASVLLTVVAVVLLHRRDVGSAMFPARLGPVGNPRLASPGALAARLHRGSLIGWAVGFAVFGVITGGIAASAADLINTSPQFAQIIARIGGAGMLIDTFLASLGAYAGLLAGAYAIAAVLRMNAEETTDRLSPLLAGPTSRTRWVAGHLTCALAGAAALLVVCGLVTGTVHGARIGDLPAGLADGLTAMVIQIPPALIMGALAMAVYGWKPQLAPAAWAGLGLALVFGLLGRALNLPQALLNLSPYTHMPLLPAADIHWAPILIEIAVAAVLVVLGTAGFRRRDIT
jgi:ABC-2 type transport system permease protein